MSEEEELGRIAYEAFQRAKGRSISGIEAWNATDEEYQQAWIAAAKAVAERVLAELQSAVEQSE